MQASWPEEGRPGSFPTRSLVGLGVGPDCLLSRTWRGLAAAPCERVSPPRHHWRRPRSPSCFRLVGATCVLPFLALTVRTWFLLASHAPGVPSWGKGGEQVAEAALRRSQVGSPGSGGRER